MNAPHPNAAHLYALGLFRALRRDAREICLRVLARLYAPQPDPYAHLGSTNDDAFDHHDDDRRGGAGMPRRRRTDRRVLEQVVHR